MFASPNSFQVGGSTSTFVSNVFSTTLYAGNSSSQTITNGIDLSSKGGLVWLKNRTQSSSGNFIFDNARNNYDAWIFTDTTEAQSVVDAIDPTSSGFSINIGGSGVNASPYNYVAWTFRKQPKFFDIVTYTGNGTTQNITHNLGSTPGCIIVKATNAADGWRVYHTSTGAGQFGALNGTGAFASSSTIWNNTAPTSTVFSLGAVDEVNRNGTSYVAYLFAHDAGGFGASGNDNIISCGSYTGNGSATGPVVTLGYQPQWLLTKRATGGTGNWSIFDSVRGIPTGSGDPRLAPNTGDAEVSTNVVDVSATGFQIVSSASFMNNSGDIYIYIAINAS